MDGEAGAKALNATRMGKSEVDVSSDANIAAAWAQCVSGSSGFIALGYTAKNVLGLLGSGEGGYASLRPYLAADAVVYGAMRVKAGDSSPSQTFAALDKEPFTDPRSKLVFVASIGENAGPMVKGRATAHTQSVEAALEGTTCSIQLADPEDYEEAAVVAKLSKALGATVSLS